MILSVRKGATAPFSCLPARMGSGKARNRVKGLVPCGFLGQRPKPSESFSESISTVFKVHLSLFFAAQFFINYLTLPSFRFPESGLRMHPIDMHRIPFRLSMRCASLFSVQAPPYPRCNSKQRDMLFHHPHGWKFNSRTALLPDL